MEQEEETCQNTSQNQINQTVSDLDEGSIGSIEVYKSMSQKEDVNWKLSEPHKCEQTSHDYIW